MFTVNIPIGSCNTGDLLAEDVFNSHKVKLVCKDTILNNYIIERLVEHGITNVRVDITHTSEDDANEKYEYEKAFETYKNHILTVKNTLINLSSGKNLDYKMITNLTDSIYKEIDNSKQLIKCLNEIKNTDEYTYTHCLNTSYYAMLIAKWLKLSENDTKKVIQAGLLHDIGKTKIPMDILNKKGRLNDNEFDIIKKHTLYGYNVIKGIGDLDDSIKKVILMHHERLDGSGYPLGVRNDDINLFTKIISVSDVFDAMTSDRVYKRRTTPFEVFQMFKTVGIGVFDLSVINTVLDNFPRYYVDAYVELNNGQKGKVVYVPPYNVSKPIILTQNNYIDLSNEGSIKIVSIIR
jgi:uncharacterized domain HDIG